jgi:Flp pilus assembly protein TadG
MRTLKSLFRQTAGAEIAEAALVLPIFLLLLLGIFWFGRAYNVYATINFAAREGARVAAARTCASCGNTGYATDATPVVTAIGQALQASNLDITQAKAVTPTYCPCGGSCATTVSCAPVGGGVSPNVCVQFNVQLNAADANVGCGVVVTFQYPYNVVLPFMNIRKLDLQSQVQAVGEF